MKIIYPPDLIAFLESGKRLEYDEDDSIIKELDVIKIEDLKVDTIYVDASFYEKGTNNYIQRYSEIKAVNLLDSCANYLEYCLLMWLPEFNMYGSYDLDHWEIVIFPNATWTDIVNDPLLYLNAPWDDDEYHGVGEVFDPTGKLIIHDGLPPDDDEE